MLGGSGRRREASGVCTVGSILSWQGSQANSTLLIRAGVAAFFTLAKDRDVTLDENNRDLHVSQRKHRRLLAGFPKLMAGAFPSGQGRRVLPGSLWPDGPVPSPDSARGAGNGTGQSEGATQEWVNGCLVFHAPASPQTTTRRETGQARARTKPVAHLQRGRGSLIPPSPR